MEAMPIGYLIHSALMATLAVATVAGHRPRRSSPFRLSHVLGFVLNWPVFAFALLAASTALAATQTGTGAGFWLGLALTAVASAALAVLRSRARRTGAVLERALDEGLGPAWRDVAPAPAARLRRRPSFLGVLLAPVTSRRRGVKRIANVRYGPAPRANLLDVYRDGSSRRGRPVLVYLHGGAFRFGDKRFGARHLLRRLAGEGWLCVSANYRLTGGSSEPLADVRRAIAWIREHADEHGADPGSIFVAGSSAGAQLASLAGLTQETGSAVAGVIGLNGYYGTVLPRERGTADAPPYLVVHGDQDRLVVVDDARRFAAHLRAASSNPVCYAELPGAQHGFDLFRSRRFDSVVDAVEAFAAWAGSRAQAGSAAAASAAAAGSRSTTCDAAAPAAPAATATSMATAEPVAPGFTVIT